MKYMGSKKAMIENGLGELLLHVVQGKRRFYDLFSGTGVVGGFLASRLEVPVFASDLQRYAVVLSASQVTKPRRTKPEDVFNPWFVLAKRWIRERRDTVKRLSAIRPSNGSLGEWRRAVMKSRDRCSRESPTVFPFVAAYGGYYYSPIQAIWLDALRATLPAKESTFALAALIQAASSCSASPGHTAQPLGLADTSLPHIAESWSKDIATVAWTALARTMSRNVRCEGRASQTDAFVASSAIGENDVAFLDPPYSDVQYSRFYHVLESVARGQIGGVHGSGRYPPREERPQSRFSLKTEASGALDELLMSVAAGGAAAVMTFPVGSASNGLTGNLVQCIADQYFKIKCRKLVSCFSSLGGNGVNRRPRNSLQELVLHLVPR